MLHILSIMETNYNGPLILYTLFQITSGKGFSFDQLLPNKLPLIR